MTRSREGWTTSTITARHVGGDPDLGIGDMAILRVDRAERSVVIDRPGGHQPSSVVPFAALLRAERVDTPPATPTEAIVAGALGTSLALLAARIHFGLLIAIILVGVVGLFAYRSRRGARLRLVVATSALREISFEYDALDADTLGAWLADLNAAAVESPPS